MRVAVAAQGKEMSSEVDTRFGRAPWFVIVDTETGSYEAVENAGTEELSGAGPKAAETMAKHEIECLIVGHCGPNAFAALKAHEIDVVVGVKGTVAHVIAELKSGRLKAADAPDATRRWS